jgi:hypothetical protein
MFDGLIALLIVVLLLIKILDYLDLLDLVAAAVNPLVGTVMLMGRRAMHLIRRPASRLARNAADAAASRYPPSPPRSASSLPEDRGGSGGFRKPRPD